MKKKGLYLVIAIVVSVALYLFRSPDTSAGSAAAYRDTTQLVYTKHARCRMGCREIDDREVKEIIMNGKLNKEKSGYDEAHHDETYALEGHSYQEQHIRVVVAPEADGLVVITVIDLDKNWVCNCP